MTTVLSNVRRPSDPSAVDLHLSEVVDIPFPLVSALIPLDVFEGSPNG